MICNCSGMASKLLISQKKALVREPSYISSSLRLLYQSYVMPTCLHSRQTYLIRFAPQTGQERGKRLFFTVALGYCLLRLALFESKTAILSNADIVT